MSRAKTKAPSLRCYQKFAWDKPECTAWEWRIVVPGKCVIKPFGERTYRSKTGARRAALKVAREFGIDLKSKE